MKVLFLGNSAVHHPLVAANLFLNQLHKADFRLTRGFCDTYHDENGYPIFIDEDERGNQVYTLGVGNEVDVGYRCIQDLSQILGSNAKELLVKPIRVNGEKIMYYTGKLPKLLGGGFLNYYLSSYLIKRDFNRIKKDVEDVREQIYS